LKQKSRKRRYFLLILTVAVVIAGTVIYLLYAHGSARRGTALLVDELVAEADYEISLGYYDRALESLDKALARARGEHNSLRILKRVYQISYSLKDFAVLHRFARVAADNIPGSNELEHIYLYAALRSETGVNVTDRLERARAARSADAAYLHAEAYFSGLLDTPPSTDPDPELAAIMSLAGEQDPYQLQRLGTDLGEPRLHLDAALLWMAEGDTESAFTVMNRHIGDPVFLEPGIFISYDAGQEQTALSLIQALRGQDRIGGRADLQIMEADLLLIFGEIPSAARLYRQIIDTHPAYSWTPYLNLASIEEEETSELQRAFALRERAYGEFPGVGAVAVAHARSLRNFGDREGAAEILQGYLEANPDDYRARLELLDVQNTASSPVLYQAALWKLYNLHPESRMLCEHLFVYLLEFNDLSGAESVLRHYQLATGRTREPWLLDYRAILSAAGRNDTEAIELLRDRLAQEDNWQARFNLAVLLGKNSRPDQAIEQLIAAENLLPEENNRYDRSRIRSAIGEQYLRLGDNAAARRECEYAIDLDVSNFHAHRILRILERD
jgi:tetratricopeptide (TPR) repeat protein